MEYSLPLIITISMLFFVVAILYSSVGHGGASGYLAVFSFFAIAPKEMSSTALLLNIVVASIAFIAFYRAGHFSLKLAFPFLITSIPLALLGGMLQISTSLYSFLLGFVLVGAAVWLASHLTIFDVKNKIQPPKFLIALFIGGGVGFLSGIVGVGGGIFLSPLFILMKWSDVKTTSAVSASFIVLNSIAGILGRYISDNLVIGEYLPLVLAASVGGYIGSRLGAIKFSDLLLRRLLAVVLVIAALKLFIISYAA